MIIPATPPQNSNQFLKTTIKEFNGEAQRGREIETIFLAQFSWCVLDHPQKRLPLSGQTNKDSKSRFSLQPSPSASLR